ncbi:alpha/beta hydrolase [Tahibacter sp.]|uniref:alpha/beta fold hydrolase n=1 Tax=Tahibacter sp. TaxID=2056211 RepID=UPI0028C495F5|nr:alpha/beta hydrolase [Tahibacter sp.]
MSARELTIELPHLTLAAQSWGDEALPPLLALHGWLDNAASFGALAPLLASRFHVVAIDLPGHGRSGHRPPGGWYHYVEYLADIQAVTQALGWQRYSLLGHSLGGATASVFAAAQPDAVQTLLLIESLGPLTVAPDAALEQLRRSMSQRVACSAKSLRVFPDASLAIRARMQVNDLSEAAASALVERGLAAVPGGWSWSSDVRLTLASPLRYTEAQIHNILRGIAAPTLVLLAQPAASYLPDAMMRARAACVADITLQHLPGNHHVHLENPAPVAAAILAFCDRVAASARVA